MMSMNTARMFRTEVSTIFAHDAADQLMAELQQKRSSLVQLEYAFV
jgi:hypothetical protein